MREQEDVAAESARPPSRSRPCMPPTAPGPTFGSAAFDPRPYPLLVDLLTLFAVHVALAVPAK